MGGHDKYERGTMKTLKTVGFIMLLSVLVSTNNHMLIQSYLRPLFVLGGIALIAISHTQTIKQNS